VASPGAKGERAVEDPQIGWRRAGTRFAPAWNRLVQRVNGYGMTPGELMAAVSTAGKDEVNHVR
jgi:hypothetical protein